MDKVKAIEVLKPLVESYVDYANITMKEEDDDIVDALEMAIEALKAPKQPEREKGRWIDMDDHVMCSCCGATHYGVDKNYCPNCGADMRGDEND